MIIGHLIIASALSLMAAVAALFLGSSLLAAGAIYLVTGNLSVLALVALSAILRREPVGPAVRLASPGGAA